MKQIGTREIVTDRLKLRRICLDDAEAMFRNWASDPEVTRFLTWPPHANVEITKSLIGIWAGRYDLDTYYHWVIEYGGEPIGTISFVEMSDKSGWVEVGYCIGRRWWGQGIVTEACRAVMEYAFWEMDAHKFIGRHDAENLPSGRVMEKLGMQKEGVLRSHHLRQDGKYGDIVCRSILREEWEMARFTGFTCHDSRFPELPELRDGELWLKCAETVPAKPEIGHVPAYRFDIMEGGEKVGEIDLRLGYVQSLFYGGNIGYNIVETYRGRGYAGRACKMLLPVMRLHSMRHAYITNDAENTASRRVCEKLGLRHVGLYDVPPDNELRKKHGQLKVNVYDLEDKPEDR